MSLLRCPGCQRTLRVPDENRPVTVRCPACQESIRLGDTTYRAEAPRPLRPCRETAPAIPPRPPRQRGLAPRRSDWLTTLAVIVPLALVALVLSPFFALATGGVFLLGFTLMVVGFKRIQGVYSSKGLTDLNETAPFFLRGGLLVLISQIYYTWQRPKTLGLWLFLELFGIVFLVTGLLTAKIVDPPPYPGYRPPAQASAGGRPGSAPVAAGAGRYAAGPAPGASAAPAAPEVPRVTGDPEIDRALADLTDEKNPPNHSRGANRLAESRPDERYRAVVAQKLAEAAEGPVEFGRGESMKALETWATRAQVPALIRCFRNGGLRDKAARALRTVGQPAEKDVRGLLDDPDLGIREEAIGVLHDIGTEDSVPALQAVVDRNEAFTHDKARDAIATIRARAGK
jgi:hypothetical protein